LSEHEAHSAILWALSSTDDSAIRSYYILALLTELLQSQRKSLLEQIALPAGMAASVISVFALLESPPSRNLTIVIYSVVLAALVISPIIDKRLGKEEASLDDRTYMGIYIDEIKKYVTQIKLAKFFGQYESVGEFVDDTKDALEGSVGYLRDLIKKLRDARKYPDCLSEIGRNEEWIKHLDADVQSILGESFLK
jgi:hypothetical protein